MHTKLAFVSFIVVRLGRSVRILVLKGAPLE